MKLFRKHTDGAFETFLQMIWIRVEVEEEEELK
jgi:hypothetical protein